MRLLIACPDARGFVAAVATCIAERGGNLLDSDRHIDPGHNEFFMRVANQRQGYELAPDTFEGAWRPAAHRFGMQGRVCWEQPVRRTAILVSK